MDEKDQVFSEDMIGRTIIGCINSVSTQLLLLDDGRTIEISNEHLSEGFWVGVGTWKPVGQEAPIRTMANGSVR